MRPGGLALACLAPALLAGCVTVRPFPAPSVTDASRLVEVHRLPDGEDPTIRPVSHRPKNVLVLSGGGMNGAYTAGVLKGWTASGDRPAFDVVTGISTGALIAPFALLGPEFDDALERSYTTLRDNDIFKRRLLVTLPWAESIADSSPLRLRIETEVTPQLLERIAGAHRAGRRLFVGTTDLDAKKLVIWDMGAIAAGNDPNRLELFRKVILASASVPGFLPPVAINVEIDGKPYTELHVDGGVSANLFLRPGMLGPRRSHDEAARDTSIYVIVAGKLKPEREVVSRNLLRIGGESIEGVLQAAFEGDLVRTYLLARHTGSRFALAAVPQEFPDRLDALKFNPAVMRKLFDEGYRLGSTGGPWLPAPPGLSPADQRVRGGVRFETLQASPEVAPEK